VILTLNAGMDLYGHAETDPALDVAVSHALLQRTARDGAESLRLWRPLRPALSVGRLDLRDQRAPELLAIARAAGVTAVKRLAGGRAATLDAGCLCLGWAQPHPVLERSTWRYELIASAIVRALAELGVRASLAESTGEWCPGAWSVQGPAGKLAGLAQRVVARGAWCEALIVVERDARLTALARRVHAALGLQWREQAQGELAALLPGRPDLHAALAGALVAALGGTWPAIARRPLPDAVRGRAVELVAEHRL
jgi:octanoyl-[GcvH]:protein N-octanoyltransferase